MNTIKKDIAIKNLAQELGRPTDFDLLEEEVCLNLIRTWDILRADFEKLFAQYGISPSHYDVLRVIQDNENKSIPMRRVAEMTVRRKSDVTRLVDYLVDKGIVLRKRGSSDRRIVWVRLTDAGCRFLEAVQVQVEELHQAHFAHLDENEVKLLNRLLFKVRHPELEE